MPSTILLRLAGPMQSWGSRSRFTERDTELEPSKSGVIGLVCAALGRPRHEAVDDLAGLKMGLRVDAGGVMAVDYHTAGAVTGIVRSSGKLSRDAVISNRYYLANANFLVGLEGDDLAQLERIEQALRDPVWQLCLGRKAFVPSVPVHLPAPGGLRKDVVLRDALRREPWPTDKSERLRVVLEAPPGSTNEVRMDQPVGAAFERRSFVMRWVETSFTGPGAEVPLRTDPPITSH